MNQWKSLEVAYFFDPFWNVTQIYYTYTRVAGRVGPNTAAKGVASHAQSRHPQRVQPANVRRGWAGTRTATCTQAKTMRPLQQTTTTVHVNLISN